MRLNGAGEIDYYEELGVDRNATPEDIRESFRALVRLLHPDQQRDEQLRSIAERQLRKVNRIYAVLSDPERRRQYDESLEDNFPPPTIVFAPGVFRPGSNIDAKQFVTRVVWIGVAVLAVAVVIWVATDPPSAPMFSTPEHVSASSLNTSPNPSSRSARGPIAGPPDTQTDTPPTEASPVYSASGSGEEVAQLRAALRAARRERDEAKEELAQFQARQDAGSNGAPNPAPHAPQGQSGPSSGSSNGSLGASAMTSASTSMADLTPPRIVPAAPRPPVASILPQNVRTSKQPGSDPHQFAGFWSFVQSSQTNRKMTLYPPEFIEATLTEKNGIVHGKYRSRYRIVDRAISPDVNFEFSGVPTNGTIACAWIGQGGARGQLMLHMTSENDLKVDWSASEVGSVQGLASGTATLTRRLE